MGMRPRSTEIIAFAGGFRREATFPEKLLWALLRNRHLGGMKFRRQHDIAPFTSISTAPKQSWSWKLTA
jgi:very-short-patch-repair endonuclease